MSETTDADRAKAVKVRDELGRWLFERDYRERGLCSPEDADWDEWVQRNREEWREEADAVLASPPVAAANAEARAPYDRLTAAVLELAEEVERQWRGQFRAEADDVLDVAARLRAVAAANEEAGV